MPLEFPALSLKIRLSFFASSQWVRLSRNLLEEVSRERLSTLQIMLRFYFFISGSHTLSCYFDSKIASLISIAEQEGLWLLISFTLCFSSAEKRPSTLLESSFTVSSCKAPPKDFGCTTSSSYKACSSSSSLWELALASGLAVLLSSTKSFSRSSSRLDIILSGSTPSYWRRKIDFMVDPTLGGVSAGW